MDLKTTTYSGRHTALLRLAASILDAPLDRPVRVIEAGPGLAVRRLGRLMRPGAPLRTVAKGLETLVRRLPLGDGWYENYETAEILAAFGRGGTELTVLDVNPRPLRIVAARLGADGVATVQADLGEEGLAARAGLAGRFDAVVALATVGRIPPDRQAAARANLIAMARPGGIVVEAEFDLVRDGGVTAVAPGVFRRDGGAG